MVNWVIKTKEKFDLKERKHTKKKISNHNGIKPKLVRER